MAAPPAEPLPRVREVLAVKTVSGTTHGLAARLPALAAVTISILLLWTVLKGLVVDPHDYAVAHYLLNYDYGFVRRGLIGSLLEPVLARLSPAQGRTVITTVSYLSLVAFVVVVIATLARRVRGPQWLEETWVWATFSVSALVWHTAMCLGYFDALGLAVAILVATGIERRPLLSLVLSVLAPFIHEVAGLACGLAWTASALQVQRSGNATRFSRLGVAATLFALTLSIAHFPPSDALDAQMHARGIADDHWVDVCIALLRDDLSMSVHRTLSTPGLPSILLDCLVRYAPATLILGLLGAHRLRHFPRHRLRGIAYLVLVSAPLSLPLVAFDFARATSWSVAGALIVYVATFPANASTSEPTPSRSRVLHAVLAAHALVWGLVPPAFAFFKPRPAWISESLRASLPDLPGKASAAIREALR